MKIILLIVEYLLTSITILSVSQLSFGQKPKDGLRHREEKYESTGIPNNCDDKI